MASKSESRRLVDMSEDDLANLVDDRIARSIATSVGGTPKVEDDLARLVDDRIAKAIGVAPRDLDNLAADPGVMSTPSVLSTVRATAAAMC